MASPPAGLVVPDGGGGPLLAWLLVKLAPTNRTRVKQLLANGNVAVNGTPTKQFDHALNPGDVVHVTRGKADPAADLTAAKIRIIAEDDAIIIIDKPAGLLTVATPGEKEDTAFARLNANLETRRGGRVYVVHRLDRETSGVMVFARSMAAQEALQQTWEDAEKTYLAVVRGRPKPPQGEVRNYLSETKALRMRADKEEVPGGKLAISEYRVVLEGERHSLVEVVLRTGRKHQIRVHMAGLRCPVIGDTAYGAKTDPVGRLGLHAWRLGFPHPTTGAFVLFEAPLPAILGRAAGQ